MNKEIRIGKMFQLLNIDSKDSLKKASQSMGISVSQLKYYNDNDILPIGSDFNKIISYTGLTSIEIQLILGHISFELADLVSKNAKIISKYLDLIEKNEKEDILPVFENLNGKLYKGDCLSVLKCLEDESVDIIFADPPFNLNKNYGEEINDNISKSEYLLWCEKWIKECIRVLKPGGAFYIYNLPYWNTYISNILNRYLNFRHWVVVSMKGLIPIANKLQPEHYALLYYIKGERPAVYNKQRIPLDTCKHCGGEIRDYGGKKSGLNPSGISISDIFMDINPVRHKKFKNRTANELPLKLLYRVIALSTNEGDIVLDPFGGSGTTYAVSEYLKRRWIGIEIGETDIIVNRIQNNQRDRELLDKIEKESNVLFTENQVDLRKKNNFWTYEILDSLNNKKNHNNSPH